MKKVLIITFYFPPMSSIGAVRLYGLAKNLPMNEWIPIFITPRLPAEPSPNFYIVQTDFHDVIDIWKKRFFCNGKQSLNEQFKIASKKNKKTFLDIISFFPSEILTYPDGMKGWINYATEAGEEIIKAEKIDAIISSSNPISCHLIAKALADKYQIPWMADLRDLWSQNHYFHHCLIRKIADSRLEKNTLSKTKALVTVSQPLADELSLLHPNKSIYVIPNGFDPEQEVIIPTKLTKKFSITYTGILYNGKRDPESFFRCVNQLLESEKINLDDIEVRFFGFHEPWLIKEIIGKKLEKVVQLLDHVPRNSSISFQRESHILLLLLWNNPKDKGVYTGKIFDYLAAKRPIIAIGGPKDSVVKELINQTQAGVYISNEKDLQEFLLQSYREYKEFGEVQYRGIEEEIKKYSHREMAKKFAELLNYIAEKIE